MINDADLVALLGTHVSGSMSKTDSGYKGRWGPNTDSNNLNNNFFKNLLGVGFPEANYKQVTTNTR